MSISAAQVKELRGMTGAGMMDCRKALMENDGNIQKAVEYLQKKSLAAASRKQTELLQRVPLAPTSTWVGESVSSAKSTARQTSSQRRSSSNHSCGMSACTSQQ